MSRRRMDVLANNLEDRPKIPWEDLQYVFGEIMYGGHITDDLDRVLCMAYLAQGPVGPTMGWAGAFPDRTRWVGRHLTSGFQFWGSASSTIQPSRRLGPWPVRSAVLPELWRYRLCL